MGLDPRSRPALAQSIVVLTAPVWADLQIAGDQEQDISPPLGQGTPNLRVLQPHALSDGAGGQLIRTHLRRQARRSGATWQAGGRGLAHRRDDGGLAPVGGA